jgi:hypothetical protein
MWIAAYRKNATMMACLVGCDRSLLTQGYKDIALRIAVEKNHPELAGLVLENAPRPNSFLDSIEKLLLEACKLGHLEIIHEFVKYGAETDRLISISPQETPIGGPGKPAYVRHILVTKLLQKHCMVGCHQKIPESSCIVSRLAWLGDVETLEILLEAEPEIELNGVDEYDNSPLFDAMYNHMRWRKGDLEGTPGRWLKTVKFLLRHGAKLNTNDGCYWAAHYQGIPRVLLADLGELAKKERDGRVD